MPQFLLTIWNRFSGAIVSAAAIIGAMLYAYLRGRSQGREAAQNQAAKERADNAAAVAEKTQDAMQGKINAQDYVNRLPAGGAADELRKHWNDDNPDGRHGL